MNQERGEILSLISTYMALQFVLSQCENGSCTQLSLQESTGPFHPTLNPGGWGGNISTSSVTSLTLSVGTKTLTVGTNLAYINGQAILITYNGSNYMSGTITSYNAVTGVLVVSITSVTGSGTQASWTVATIDGNVDISAVTAITVEIEDPNGNTATISGGTIVQNQTIYLSNYSFGYSTTLPDGIYTVTTTLTISGVDYVYTYQFFSTCNVQCCVFNKMKTAKEKALGCDGCDEDISFELFLWARWKDLKFMAAGCDLAGASAELTKLQVICGIDTDCGCS